MAPVLHFGGCVAEPDGDLLGGFGAAFEESAPELFDARRHDEDVGESFQDEGVAALADHGSAAGVNINEDVHAAAEAFDDGGFESAVEVAMDFGMFEELAILHAGGEFFTGKEEVVFAVDFARAGGACGAGDGVDEVGFLAQGGCESGFSGAGGSGEDEEDAIGSGEITRHWPVVREAYQGQSLPQRQFLRCGSLRILIRRCSIRGPFPGRGIRGCGRRGLRP